jgi:hypothetical protein
MTEVLPALDIPGFGDQHVSDHALAQHLDAVTP